MYEREYHSSVHKNLLLKKRYYYFRAKCANKFYLRYLKGKVLEFGCGLGQNIFLQRKRSFGVDISEFALEECKKRGIGASKDISKVKNESFDGVLGCHVLEHLKNPYETVEEFYRVLKKKGRLVVVLPYSKKNKPVKGFKSDIAKHFYNWNFYSINELLTAVGFKVKVNKFNYAHGYSKVYEFPFNLSLILLRFLGKIRDKKEMIIVGEK